MSFPGDLDCKESPCNVGGPGSIPGWRRSLEKGMTTFSSILAYRFPWTEELGGLLSVGSQRVGHDWATNSIGSRWYHFNGRKWKGKKSLLMKAKEESEKAGFKLNIWKSKIVESGFITSWQTGGGKLEAVTDFIFLGFKITADRNCSHEYKRHLLLGRRAVRNLDSILKSRAII